MTKTVQVRAASGSARVVFTVQVALLVAYLIGSFGLLLSAMHRTGDYAAFFHPDVERLGDPKDSMNPIGPDALSNPIVWTFALSRMVAFFVQPLALASTALGIVFLAASWRAGNGRAVRLVIVSTAAWLAVSAFAFTPYSAELLRWLLD